MMIELKLMSVSLQYLAWTLVLALIQLMLTAVLKRGQDGMQWAAGNRDTAAPAYSGVPARMQRAFSNLQETLPIFIGAVLLAHVLGHDGRGAAWGAGLYFWARLAYIPAYASGIGLLRSGIWAVSFFGLVTVLASLVAG